MTGKPRHSALSAGSTADQALTNQQSEMAEGPNETARAETPLSPMAKPRKKKRRQGPIRIGDALRNEGLGEQEVARKLADVVTRHTPEPNEDAEGGTDKLLVDVLKECLRHLESSSTAPSGSAVVRLIHKVPRPDRSEPQGNPEKGTDT